METRTIYAIILPFIIPALAYGNPVNNPSMEGNFIYQGPLGDVAEYWTGYRVGGYLEGDFDEGSYAYDGTKSQLISWYKDGGNGQFGPDGIYQQITSLQPGQVYRVSVWFKFDFSVSITGPGFAYSDITFSVGTDPNGGTDPNAVTNWSSTSDYTDYGEGGYYEGSWINVVTFFSPNAATATLFIKANGQIFPDYLEDFGAYCYIDDVNAQIIQINQDSTVSATTPVPANGANYSEITITVLDPNFNGIEGIPAWEIDINCSGSGNIIYGLDSPTDANGQTKAKIASTVSETKTVSASVLGTLFYDTATIYFCESRISKLRPSDGAAVVWFGWSMAVSGNTAIIGARYDNDNGFHSGSAYIFRYDGLNWVQQDKLLASDGAASDYFGYSVAISGDTAVIGAYNDDDNGSAYIFRYDGLNWVQQAKLLASDGAAGEYFGYSVSIDGDHIIVGAWYDDDNGSASGSGYIFAPDSIDPNNWVQQDKLLASDGEAYDYFGRSVAIDGNTALVGAHSDGDNGSDSGSAYIFRYDGLNWVQQDKLLASDGASGDRFGYSVSISGDHAIVGAYGNDDNGSASGSAYIFRYDGLNWVQQDKLLASDGAAEDYFGRSVSISGDHAIVGANRDDDNGSDSGSAYIFAPTNSIDPNNWDQEDKLLASDGAANDWFGRSVAIDGDTALVGAYGADDNGINSGAAYVFTVLPADVDGDGDVDFADFSILADQWFQLPGQPSADIAPCGGDCVIDTLDLKVLYENWLK